MSPDGKIKIRVRGLGPSHQAIEVKEKEIFSCKNCQNRYNSYFYFCPQCLGLVAGSGNKKGYLKMVSLAEEKRGEAGEILRYLTGKTDFDFQKAFRSLPWLVFRDTEIQVLQSWQEVMEAAGAKVEVREGVAEKKWRGPAALLTTAPLPAFLPASLESDLRQLGATIQNVALRLKVAEIVIHAFEILQSFYKKDPSRRVLFSDFLVRIEEGLRSCVKHYDRRQEDSFMKTVETLAKALNEMTEEMDAVRRQVEEQL